jgi:hypothetical protein
MLPLYILKRKYYNRIIDFNSSTVVLANARKTSYRQALKRGEDMKQFRSYGRIAIRITDNARTVGNRQNNMRNTVLDEDVIGNKDIHASLCEGLIL